MDKFQVGNTYQAICWFTGAMFTYQCVKRTDTEITFSPISKRSMVSMIWVVRHILSIRMMGQNMW